MSITDLAQYKKLTAPRHNNLDQWLAWQEKLHFTAIEMGLDRCRKVAEIMQLLPPSFFIISIAGTNGKGSSAVMLESILRDAGYKVGLYTSPHLLRYNERIKVDGHEINDLDLCESFHRIDLAREKISLTYFEFATLAAIDIFKKNNVDIAILEVGMGGRLDAVNMLDANVSLISTVDIDHEKWLGSDRETIGMEKAGIIRSMRPAICSDPNPPNSVFESANIVGAKLLVSGRDFNYEYSHNTWSWKSGAKQFSNLPIPANLNYQIKNASGVLMVLQEITDYFPVNRESIDKGLQQFRLSGRFQVVPGEVPIILDVAHNCQSATILGENISELPKTGETRVVLGMLNDKNHATFMSALSPYVDNWYLSDLDNNRGADVKELAATLSLVNIDAEMIIFEDINTALASAIAASKAGDRIIVTGSFITVAIAIKYLDLEKNIGE
ncbi:MAG: bifunctional tetrahydrofolate synthase/dihydrofolate synthase [Gammaproteobacteria bacterium]|jgi:dihydrofolate synthase/folylpolyglutamate synthase